MSLKQRKMTMNKKYIKLGIIGGFILVTGISYSLTFAGCSTKTAPSTSLSNADKKEVEDKHQSDKDLENKITPEITPGGLIISTAKKHVVESRIYVHICGAVKKPGVYQVDTGSRIYDLIKMSGGLKKNAAGDYINQAEQVTDGQRIYIPTFHEVKSTTPEEYVQEKQNTVSQTEEKKSGLININTAEAEELMTLPGIGQAKADSIIEYRTQNGKFKSIEDLMNITGIKEGVYNRISSYVTVN